MLRRVKGILLLPAIIFLWVIGWGLYWIGSQRVAPKHTPKIVLLGRDTAKEDTRSVDEKDEKPRDALPQQILA